MDVDELKSRSGHGAFGLDRGSIFGLDESDGDPAPVGSLAADYLIRVARPQDPLGVFRAHDFEPDRTVIFDAGLAKSVWEARQSEPRDMSESQSVFHLFLRADGFVDLKCERPGLNKFGGGKRPGAHRPVERWHSIGGVGSEEFLDDFRPSSSPHLDDVLGAHSVSHPDRLLADAVNPAEGLEVDELGASFGQGVVCVPFGFREVADQFVDGPSITDLLFVPVARIDPLQQLIKCLFFGYQVGKYFSQSRNMVAGLVAARWKMVTMVGPAVRQ